MKIDPAWLAAFGAILAAAAAFFAAVHGSRTQARIARDQHIIDARRVWIGELRAAVAAYLTSISRARTLLHGGVAELTEGRRAMEDVTRNSSIVRLMIDRRKPHHQRLINAMSEAMKLLVPADAQNLDYAATMNAVENSAADLIDEAWERVKRGD